MTAVDAGLCARWMAATAALVTEHADELTALDTAIGDGDHGLNLRRGFAAAAEAVGDTPGAVLKAAGTALVNTTGGASGPLYGTFLRRAAKALGDDPTATATAFAAALGAGLEGVRRLGGAAEGDKTMIDALAPAVAAFTGDDFSTAARAAADAAASGRDATKPLVARKGRASYLGERSAGHIDPGAASSALLFEALAGLT